MSKHKQQKVMEEKEQENPTCAAQPSVEAEPTPDYYDQYVRLAADFENFRKRTEREKAALLAYGKREFAVKMLPMYEVLLRQQKNVHPAKEKEVPNEVKQLQDGMRMILSELDKAFKSEGITKMDVLKKPYDPSTQEVVAMIPSKKEEDGLVLEEVQMGFMIDGQILRPARVVVGQCREEGK